MVTKEEILKELQEYSQRIGKTPSEKAFYDYSGIKLHNLHKLGWSNWRELVIDAGLLPNKFDKTKYTHEKLCELFIEAIREKGKWPTRGDLDVMHHINSFPESGTFYDKLGKVKTGDLARTILNYIKDRPRFDDITAICTSILEGVGKFNEISEKTADTRKHGWVYLFKHGHYNHYRIGQTYDILRRGKEIRIQLPERAVLIHTIETIDPIGVEAYWLNRFKEKRMNGDWFSLNKNDENEFKSWKRII